MFRFIHTADWQIGKSFREFGDRQSILREARLTAIERIGRLAMREGIEHVLVAGDMYDTDVPAHQTLMQPMERMRNFERVAWHLIPGNHDPHRPQGLWDRLRAQGVPANVSLCLSPVPQELAPSVFLLPAPLTRKSESRDVTEWMDSAETPPGATRIGLAHGSVVDFGSGGEASNPIDPARADKAALSYLALGDWHRTIRINPSTWYAGTPEPDRVGSQEEGQCLIVELAGPRAPASIRSEGVGAYRWQSLEQSVASPVDLADIEAKLRDVREPSSVVMQLILNGSLPLSAFAELDYRCAGLEAAFFRLRVDRAGLAVQPTEADLEAIDFGGVLRDAAARLKTMAEDERSGASDRERARQALVELFLLSSGGATRGRHP